MSNSIETSETETFGPFLTRHAARRSQQRGIKACHRDFVFAHGDREVPVGGGCFRLTISYRGLKLLVQQGLLSPTSADRCARLAVITDGKTILTNYQQD